MMTFRTSYGSNGARKGEEENGPLLSLSAGRE
jgi:hypothetical protein